MMHATLATRGQPFIGAEGAARSRSVGALKTRDQAPVKPQKIRRGIQVSPMRSTRMRARAA